MGEPVTVPAITSSEEALETMLLNLLENAIKYNREGGSVSLGLSHEGGEVIVAVTDTGIGVPQRDLSRIFERFYRIDRGRSRTEGGTGLGLAIVKHPAQLHGGRVEVESKLGQGSVFRVHLPVDGRADRWPAAAVGAGCRTAVTSASHPCSTARLEFVQLSVTEGR